MTLAEHLGELRGRLLKAFLALGAGAVVALILYNPIFRFLTKPYCELDVAHRLPGSQCLVVTGIFDAFTIRLKVALIAGTLLSSPFWLYQIWAFVTPGLHRQERRWARLFGAASALLFAGGVFFGYVTLGRALAFLLSFADQVTPIISISTYLNFVSKLLIIFGASFEFPLALVMLNFAGVLSAARMASAWRMIIFGIFVFAAVITPSQDPITMCGMAIPLTLLYGVALLVARAHDRRVARREASSPYASLDDDAPSPLDLDSGSERVP